MRDIDRSRYDQREQPVAGDGDPVRVTAQVFQDLWRTAKRRFGVPHPLAVLVRAQQFIEGESIPQRPDGTGKHELVSIESVFQAFEKQTAKQTRKHLQGKEKSGRAADPALMVRRKTAARHDAVQMGMVQQPPTVP